MVTDSDYQQKLDTNNEQKIEINQLCENVELCVIDLYNLNRQIVYGNTEYADK